ncbi:MAG: hypothetical protein DCC65_00200 [Planctomycetota bacterium]|nr:MAG: hypothetical protein DCC65_00200 [Planctomycetota bacterium]
MRPSALFDYFSALILLICFSSAGAAPQMADAAPTFDAASLHLRSGRVSLPVEASLHTGRGRPIAAGHFVVQLDGPLNPDRAAALAREGVILGEYLPMNAYLVRLPAGFDIRGKLGGLAFVRWVAPFDKSWKLDPAIGRPQFETPARQAQAALGRVQLVVALFEGSDLNAALERIASLPDVSVLNTDTASAQPMIELSMPLTDHSKLAEIDEVQWVEEAPELTKRNSSNKWILQTNVTNSTTVWDRGIRGENQVGHVCDGAVKTSHCSFSDPAGNPIGPSHRKILAYFGTTGSDSHGTHVAGTCLGNEQPVSGGTTNRGLAYLAKLVFTNVDTEISSTNLFTKLQQAHNAGARVHTNSWGNDSTTSYNSWARDIDRFSHTYEESLVIFAVTNINSTIRNPENAKNCLAVAACTDSPATSHCSGGYATTNDGRRKPELMAPGCSTVSAQSSTTCGFTGSGFTGTSMAAPAVAGAALLARQYYTDGYYPSGAADPADAFTPSAALVRATLINSGADVTGITGYPSSNEGWGRVLLENTLYFAGDSRKLVVLDDIRNADGLTTGQSRSYQVNVNSAGSPLKVTLVWTEKEAALNANPAYINNMNLEVVAPGGITYKGNDFSGGQSTTGGAFDTTNNVEQVLRNVPATGAYTINVNAPTVNTTTPQGFALLVTGDVSVTAPAPAIASIAPNAADADSIVNITNLAGSNFQLSGATAVKLARTGFPDVPATGVSVISPSQITCAFNLSGVEVGLWDVVVINPDAQSATLANGFQVTVSCLKGDMNGDSGVDSLDIARFVDILISGGGLAVEKCAGDVEAVPDQQIDLQDVPDFVDCLINGGC